MGGTTNIFVAILLIFIVMLLIGEYLLTASFQPKPVLSTVTDGLRLLMVPFTIFQLHDGGKVICI